MSESYDWAVLVDSEGRRSGRPETLRVPMLSGAVRFGEGALAVLRTIGADAYLAHRHIARLERSCELLGLEPPDPASLYEDLASLPSRGPWRLRWTISDDGQGGVMRWLYATPIDDIGSSSVHCICLEGQPTSLPGAKTTSYAFARYALRHAQSLGADDALVFRDGALLEGATSNAWVVRRGKVQTPMGEPVLAGVTQGRLFELADAVGLDVEPVPIGVLRKEDLRRADEVWLSSSVRGLRRVAQIEDCRLPERSPLFDAMAAAYRADLNGDWGDGRLLPVFQSGLNDALEAHGYTMAPTGDTWASKDSRWQLQLGKRRHALFWRKTYPGGGRRLRALEARLGGVEP